MLQHAKMTLGFAYELAHHTFGSDNGADLNEEL